MPTFRERKNNLIRHILSLADGERTLSVARLGVIMNLSTGEVTKLLHQLRKEGHVTSIPRQGWYRSVPTATHDDDEPQATSSNTQILPPAP